MIGEIIVEKFKYKLIKWLLHKEYIKYKQPIFYIKEYDNNNIPKWYLLYTEDENVYYRMDEF